MRCFWQFYPNCSRSDISFYQDYSSTDCFSSLRAMKLSHNKALYVELFTQIARMHDEVAFRKHLNSYWGSRGKWKDYPAVSVGAGNGHDSAIGHHHSYSVATDFHPLVLQELTNRLGDLNETSTSNPMCTNKVGHCAENYAATGVLRAMDPEEQNRDTDLLGNLSFTKAFRPRIWKNIDWCANCHTMFD